MKDKKISIKEAKKIPVTVLMGMIRRAKNYLKKDEVWQKLCKENDVAPEIIDLIPTKFGTLDVSAKTDHGVVILSYKLLCDGDFFKDYGYLIHEYSHWFQQCFGDKPTQGSDEGDYLDNPSEQEGFANQVEYIANHEGDDKAEEYVDDLLEYHDADDKGDKKEILMANV